MREPQFLAPSVRQREKGLWPREMVHKGLRVVVTVWAAGQAPSATDPDHGAIAYRFFYGAPVVTWGAHQPNLT
jgi:hypothetical protein